MNDVDTFIAVSEDCPAIGAAPPAGKRSVAEIQYAMLVEQHYRHTQKDVLFASSTAMRNDPSSGSESSRRAFFERPQACLRCSPLVKRWGWGIHFDAEGRAAAFAKGSEEYRQLSEDLRLNQTKGMRSKKA